MARQVEWTDPGWDDLAGIAEYIGRDSQDAILVNQVGKRVYNELAEGWPYGTHHGFLDPYVHGDWRNPKKITYAPDNYQDALLQMNEGSKAPDFAAGPTWAVFDADAVVREKWNISPPYTDPVYFYSANARTRRARANNPSESPLESSHSIR